MTVAELIAALRGIEGDRQVMVRIQGLSRPVEGVFTETERRMSPKASILMRSSYVDPDAEVETVDIRRLILSDRKYH